MRYYRDVQASLLAFTNRMVADLKPSVSADLQNIKFDAYADPKELPETDLIGPFKFELLLEAGPVVTTMFVISSLNDTNLYRLDEMVDHVLYQLAPEKSIPVVNGDTGDQIGLFTVAEGVSVLPVEDAGGRPMKAIAVEMRMSHFPS